MISRECMIASPPIKCKYCKKRLPSVCICCFTGKSIEQGRLSSFPAQYTAPLRRFFIWLNLFGRTERLQLKWKTAFSMHHFFFVVGKRIKETTSCSSQGSGNDHQTSHDSVHMFNSSAYGTTFCPTLC